MSQQQQQQQGNNNSGNNNSSGSNNSGNNNSGNNNSGASGSGSTCGAKSHGPSWQSQYWGKSDPYTYSDIVMAGKAHHVVQYKQDGTPDMRYRLSKEAVAMGCEYGEDED